MVNGGQGAESSSIPPGQVRGCSDRLPREVRLSRTALRETTDNSFSTSIPGKPAFQEGRALGLNSEPHSSRPVWSFILSVCHIGELEMRGKTLCFKTLLPSRVECSSASDAGDWSRRRAGDEGEGGVYCRHCACTSSGATITSALEPASSILP